MSLEESFNAAAEKARGINGVSKDNQGKLYGLFKQATVGPNPSTKRPGIFDPVGRAKFDAWKGFEVLSKEDAMTQYVALVESL